MLSASTITAPVTLEQTKSRAEQARVSVIRGSVIRVWAVTTCALGCAWMLAFNLVDPDLWGHIRYGQDWIAAGELPRTATHTFTAVGHPWINHENLAELALAWSYETLGVTGMLAAKCALGMAIIAAMVWIATKRGGNPFIAWAFMLLIAFNLQPFFILRPQLFSFAFCAITLVLLHRAFLNWHLSKTIDARYLWCLPLVMIVWANSHGGFVAGLAIVGAYIVGRIIELLIRRINYRQAAQLTLVGFAILCATLVNPYGWQLHRWLFVSLIEPRPEITEWLAPQMSDPTFWPWIAILAVIAVSLFATRERRDWVEIAILLLVVWQSTLHLRHIAFVALVAGFWIPVHFQSTLNRFFYQPTGGSLRFMNLLQHSRLAIAAALLIAIALQAFALEKRLTTFQVERSRYPVDAIQFMSDRQLEGKLVVAFNWAQYTLAALSPRVTVGFDGRYDTCYPLEVVDMHFDFLLGNFGGNRNRASNSGPIDATRALKHENPDLVLIDRHYESAVATMKSAATKPNPKWVLLYCDRVAELWGRASRYDDQQSPDFIAACHRVLDASPREGTIAWPALPLPLPNQPANAETIAIQD